MTPLAARSDARRNHERILAAARECLAAEGLGVSMATIARHAGVGNATLFRNFPTREALVVAMLEGSMAELLEQLGDQLDRGASPLDDLGVVLDALIDGLRRSRFLIDFVRTDSVHSKRLELLAVQLHRLIDDCVARGVADGSIRGDVSGASITMLFKGLACIDSNANDVAAAVRVVLDGLRAG